MCQFETIPQWLLQPTVNLLPTGRNQLNFLRRTLHHLAGVFSNEVYLAKNANKAGLLQHIDPRCKLFVLMLFIIVVNFTHGWLGLVLLGGIGLLYAKLSQLNITNYLIRVWVYIPLFILICSLPALFNIVTNGVPIVELIKANSSNQFFSHGLFISLNGVQIVGKLFLRSGVTLGFAYLLMMTTSWHDLTRSLSLMKIPASFVVILDMAYRYIFLLAIIALQLSEARFLRSVGKLTNHDNRKFVGHSIALLFIKASYLAEEIFAAMRLRGFSGRYISLKVLKITFADVVFVINNLVILAILYVLGRG